MTPAELAHILRTRGRGPDGAPPRPAEWQRVAAEKPPALPQSASVRSIEVLVPVRTVSEANSHAHWRDRQRRAKAQRQAVRLAFAGRVLPVLPVAVTMTRLGPTAGLDDDNLAISCKHLRDEIASLYGVDDRDSRIRWAVDQRRAAAWGVRVEISAAAAAASMAAAAGK